MGSLLEPCVSYSNQALPGYTLFDGPNPAGTGLRALLVDMRGELVNTWDVVGFPAKLLPGGKVLAPHRMREGFNLVQDALSVVQMDWDGQIEWSFSKFDGDGTGTLMARQHHDLQRQGNTVGYYHHGAKFVDKGRTLILAHRTVTVPKISKLKILDDTFYEVDWSGKLTGFTWSAVAHVDQMGLDAAARADIAQNPNYNAVRGAGDWLHVNAMSTLGQNRFYRETKDQRFHPDNIIFSSREASFIAIVSRASGAIVWRVGPDFSKGKPGADLGPIVGPHHAHMIPEGLPGSGNILVFDNGGAAGYGGANGSYKHQRAYSRVLEFDPSTLKIVWQYGSASGSSYFFSPFVCSAQRLPNGNTLVNVGGLRTLFEVTPTKKEVWRFVSPWGAGASISSTYRAYRVPPEWLPEGKNAAGYPPWSRLCSNPAAN